MSRLLPSLSLPISSQSWHVPPYTIVEYGRYPIHDGIRIEAGETVAREWFDVQVLSRM